MYFLLPLIGVVVWLALWVFALRLFGLRLFTYYWGMSTESMAPWRRIGRWRYVFIYGIVMSGAALLVPNLIFDYQDGTLGLYHLHLARFIFRLALYFIFGLGVGLSSWKRICDPKFDPAT